MSRGSAARTLRGLWSRRLVRWSSVLLVLLLLAAVALARGIGMQLVVPRVLARAAPPGWTVEVGEVDGAWTSRMRLRGLEVRAPHLSASVEELQVAYALLPLFRRTIALEAIEVDRPRVTLRPDTAAPPDTTAAPDTAAVSILTDSPLGDWTVALHRVRVAQGALALESDEGTWHLRDLRVAASGALEPSGLRLALDTLDAAIEGWRTGAEGDDAAGPGSGRLATSASLRDAVLRVDSLVFVTSRSTVNGGGELALAPARPHFERADFRLAADPLDLRDLPLTLPPPLESDPRVRLDLVAEGAPDSVLVRGEVRALGAASADLLAVVRADAEDGPSAGPPAVTADLDVRDVDLAPWAPPPFDGIAEARLRLALERLDAASPLEGEGTLVHHAPADTVGGLLGGPLRLRFDVSRHASLDAPARQGSAGPDDGNAAAQAANGSNGSDGGAAAAGAAVVELSATLERPRTPDRSPAEDWDGVAVVEARVAGQRSDWTLDLGLDGSEVRGRGSASWSGEVPRVEVERLALGDFDLQRVLSGLPATSVSGTMGARLAGTGPDDLSGTVDVRLDRSTFTSLVVDSLALTADVGDGTANGRVMVSDSIRRVVAGYRVALRGERIEADVPDLRLSTIGPAADSAVVEAAGRASGSWLLSDSLPRSGTLDAVIDSARVADARVTGGSLHAELDGERITARASGVARALLPGTVRVEADLDARGADPASLTGRLDLVALRTHPVADTTQVADSAQPVDSLHASVVANEPGRFRLDGRLLPAHGGRLLLDGTGTVADGAVALDVRAHGSLPAGTALLDGAAVDTVSLALYAVRDSTTWERVDARLLSAGGAWREVRMDSLRASVTAGPEGIALDSLRLDSNVATLRGAGMLPAAGGEPGTIEILGTLVSLDPVERSLEAGRLVADSGSLRIAAAGTLDSLEVAASFAVAALAAGSLRMDGLRAGANAVVRPPLGAGEAVGSGTASLALERLLLPAAEVRSVDVAAEGGLDSLRIEADAIVDDTRTGTLTLVVDRRPEARTALIEALDFQLDEDVWRIQAPSLVTFADGVAIDSLRLTTGAQSIAIHGGVSGDGALDLMVEVDSTNIGTVTDLAGFPALHGWIAGQARLEGTVDAPRGVADLRGAFHRPEQTPAPARIALDADGRRISADIALEDPEGGLLTIAGSARLPGAPEGEVPTPTGDTIAAPEALDFTVAAAGLRLSWVLPFLQPSLVENLDGTLQGEMTVQGSLDAPGLGGALRVQGGRVRLPPLGVVWEDMSVTLRGSGSDIVVDSARVRGGDGTMTVNGAVTVADEALPIDFTVALDDFQAIRNESYQATVSGELNTSGTATAPVIDGRVMVESLDVYLDQVLGAGAESLESVELTEEDYRMLEERFGYVPERDEEGPPASETLTADLVIEFSRDSWLRKRASPEMAVAFTGALEAQVRPFEEPMLTGSLEVIERRGYIEQFGKRFELSEGTVTLEGPPSSARVDLAATYTVPSRGNPDDAEATIVLSVEGTQESLALTLSSDPPMENADIVSYLATGRPASSALAFEGEGNDGLVAAGADLALGQIAGALEGAAARSIGLDVVEIQREGLRQATLVAGKYVTPRLFVGFARPITLREGDGLSLGEGSQGEIEVELQALRWLLVNVEASGSIFRLFLRGRRAY